MRFLRPRQRAWDNFSDVRLRTCIAIELAIGIGSLGGAAYGGVLLIGHLPGHFGSSEAVAAAAPPLPLAVEPMATPRIVPADPIGTLDGHAESPLPIDRYLSTMSVKSDGHGGSIVTWVGQFSRKNPRANPPEAENDASVVGLITGAYQGGLQNLKKVME